jgi:hypothetical protein
VCGTSFVRAVRAAPEIRQASTGPCRILSFLTCGAAWVHCVKTSDPQVGRSLRLRAYPWSQCIAIISIS